MVLECVGSLDGCLDIGDDKWPMEWLAQIQIEDEILSAEKSDGQNTLPKSTRKRTAQLQSHTYTEV